MWFGEDDDEKILDKGHEKYSPGTMCFGGITAEGLVPRNGPIFMDQMLKKKCKKFNKEKKTLDNRIYADMIKLDFRRILERDLIHDLSHYIWQDDGDKKHRTAHVLETLNGVFAQRVDVKTQSDKMADVWPIENVWGMIYSMLEDKEFANLDALKRAIRKVWREITPEQCKKMMESIPRRLQAVIDRDGEQIHKKDYSSK